MPHRPSRRALVMSYSPTRKDARVTNQVSWLEDAGYAVDLLSSDPDGPALSGRRLRIGRPSLPFRVAAAVLPPAVRFRLAFERYLPRAALRGHRYDLVVVDDLQLVPWLVSAAPELTDGAVVLDLHEIYRGNGTGWIHRRVIAPYDEWLLGFVTSEVFTERLTVTGAIADLYRDEFGVPRPTVVRNVAPREDLEPTPVNPDRILLEHHGYATVGRGIDEMLDAALLLEPRFHLVLMLMGDESAMRAIERHPAVVGGRAELRDPVPITEVARTINDCDLEVIFLPPEFQNRVYALPNKFFEAIQGRLGVVIGRSPEMQHYVDDLGVGIVVDGWSAEALAAAINALTVEQIRAMKCRAHESAFHLSAEREGERFLKAVGA